MFSVRRGHVALYGTYHTCAPYSLSPLRISNPDTNSLSLRLLHHIVIAVSLCSYPRLCSKLATTVMTLTIVTSSLQLYRSTPQCVHQKRIPKNSIYFSFFITSSRVIGSGNDQKESGMSFRTKQRKKPSFVLVFSETHSRFFLVIPDTFGPYWTSQIA